MRFGDKAMDLKRLKTFVAVADLGTVSKAEIVCALASLPCRGKSVISNMNADSSCLTVSILRVTPV